MSLSFLETRRPKPSLDTALRRRRSEYLAFVDALKGYNVLVVPGRGFGMPGYFRISFCVDDKTLEGSLEGFREAIGQFR